MKKRDSLAVWIVLLMVTNLFGQEPTTLDVVSPKADSWTPDPGFISLFNGKDLSGWCFRARTGRKATKVGELTESFEGKTQSDSDGRYSVQDGILTVRFPEEADRLTGQLYTVAEFPEDFVLKLEFRASVNADSGIFIRSCCNIVTKTRVNGWSSWVTTFLYGSGPPRQQDWLRHNSDTCRA